MNVSEYNKLQKRLNEFDTICVDLFDTILIRRYNDDYSFLFVANNIIQEYALDFDLLIFAQSLKKFFYDISPIKRIYYHYRIFVNDTFCAFESKFKQWFLAGEYRNTYPDFYTIKFLNSISQQKVVIISDYYFGKGFLIQLLAAHKLDIKFDDIIVNVDTGLSKWDGSIFKTNNFKNPLMIGDNYRSDCLNARRCNFHTFLLHSNKKQKLSLYTKIINKELNKIVEKKSDNSSCNIVFVIFEFCKKLYRKLKPNETVYFLSREGQFLKNCFDHYLTTNNLKNIKTDYLYVSRYSLAFLTGCFSTLDHEQFIQTFIGYGGWPNANIVSVFASLGVSLIDLEKEGYITDNSNTLFYNDIRFSFLWNNQNIQSKIEHYRKIISDSFFSLFDDDKQINLVDIGWHGSMQKSLSSILNNKKIIGYYLFIDLPSGENINSNSIGLISDSSVFKTPYGTSFETLLRANHGYVVSSNPKEPICVDDSSLTLFNLYSRQKQDMMKKMFNEINNLDQSIPLSDNSLFNIFIASEKYRNSYSRALDRYNFSFQAGNNVNYNPPNKTFKYILHDFKNKVLGSLHLGFFYKNIKNMVIFHKNNKII